MTEDEKFEKLLSEKRHNELVTSMGSIVSELKKEKRDPVLIAAIEKQAKIIESFVSVVGRLPKPEKPEVNVRVNQSEVVSSVVQMGNSILQGLNDLKAILSKEIPQKEWEFKVKRSGGGYIESVAVVQK